MFTIRYLVRFEFINSHSDMEGKLLLSYNSTVNKTTYCRSCVCMCVTVSYLADPKSYCSTIVKGMYHVVRNKYFRGLQFSWMWDLEVFIFEDLAARAW